MGGLGVVLILAGGVGWLWVAFELFASLGRVGGGDYGGLAFAAAGAALGGPAGVLASGFGALFVAGVVLVAAASVQDAVRAAVQSGAPETPPPAPVYQPALPPSPEEQRAAWLQLLAVIGVLVVGFVVAGVATGWGAR